MTITITKDRLRPLVARFFYLAWKACGKPSGAGVSQDRPDAGEDDVLSRALSGHDTGAPALDYPTFNTSDSAYSDYCFGRRMKIGVQWTFVTPLDKELVEVSVADQSDWSAKASWVGKYRTPADLLSEAMRHVP